MPLYVYHVSLFDLYKRECTLEGKKRDVPVGKVNNVLVSTSTSGIAIPARHDRPW